MWLYTDLLQALKGERLSSVFSPDGTLISASAAPHCGKKEEEETHQKEEEKKKEEEEEEKEKQQKEEEVAEKQKKKNNNNKNNSDGVLLCREYHLSLHISLS